MVTTKIFWVKFGRDPWWPAREATTLEKFKCRPTGKDKIRVFFFGTQNFAIVHTSKIIQWSAGLQSRFHEENMIQKALAEAEEYDVSIGLLSLKATLQCTKCQQIRSLDSFSPPFVEADLSFIGKWTCDPCSLLKG